MKIIAINEPFIVSYITTPADAEKTFVELKRLGFKKVHYEPLTQDNAGDYPLSASNPKSLVKVEVKNIDEAFLMRKIVQRL